MRSRLLFCALLVAFVVLPAAGGATFTISISKSGFAPGDLTIVAGDTVTWRNDDTAAHQIASKSAGFTSPLLKPGETFSFVYKDAGRFAYQNQTVKKNRGTVTVQGASESGSVTAAASSTLIVYGGAITLSGATSSKRAGETVAVYSRPFGAAAFAAIGSAVTEGGGTWSFLARPKLETGYEARWKPAATQVTSPLLDVRVRPQVLFRVKAASGRTVTFFAKARAARSLAGKTLSLQRRNAFGQWVTLRRVTLTATSAATFTARLPLGRSRLRMLMPKAQAGPGYVAGISHTLSVTR